MDIKTAVLPAYNKIRRLSFAVKSNRLLACEDFRSLDTLYRDSLLLIHLRKLFVLKAVAMILEHKRPTVSLII